eukprot:470319_1
MAAKIGTSGRDDTSEQSPTQQKHKKKNKHVSYSYNDIVILDDDRIGKIKFIGALSYHSETWCGLILSTPTGTHNGIVKNRKYWICKHNHGTFVKRSQIRSIKQERIGTRFTIHQMVKTPKGKGYIRFIGAIYHKHSLVEEEWFHENGKKDKRISDVMYGIELCDQIGENSGSIGTDYYFTCPHYRGMFYKESDLIYIEEDTPKRITNKSKLDDTISKALIDDTVLTEQDEDSLSDSSSDDEFLSSDEMKRLSLTVNGQTVDDRLSFARILSGFKHVQKKALSNVRARAQQYEDMTKHTQRFSIHKREEKTEAELAKDIIKNARRQRADTLPHTVGSASFTQPQLRFVDAMIQEREKKPNKPASLSNPVSPRSTLLKDRSKAKDNASGFNRVIPKGKRAKRRNKMRFDEFSSNMIDPNGQPRPLSPTSSLNATDTIAEEEGDVEQESPMNTPIASTKDDASVRVPFSKLRGRTQSAGSMSKSVPMNQNNNNKLTTKSVAISCADDTTSNGSDCSGSMSSHGYVSPGIISPGGGMSNLRLQDSASLNLEDDNHSVAVVSNDDDEIEGGDSKEDEMDEQTPFKLKAKPDSPFDVSSTRSDFEKVAEVLMLECNNPKNLFRILKGVASKLKLPNPKYRRIDTQNSFLQNKLLRFDGAEEFLRLLGFGQSTNNQNIWYCERDQPPLSVLDCATNVCNDCLLKCNNKRATVDMLKKFSKNDSKKKKKKKQRKKKKKKKAEKNMDSLNENAVFVELRNGSIHVDGTMSGEGEAQNECDAVEVMIEDEDAKQEELPQPQSTLGKPSGIEKLSLSPQNSMDMQGEGYHCVTPNGSDAATPRTMSLRIDDLDEIKFEQELEGGDEDRFQLSDIVWSVTHKMNTDTAARAIILLCFPMFSDEYKLIKCLIERFFEPEWSGQVTSKTGTSTAEVSMSISDSDYSETASLLAKFDFQTHAASMLRIESCWEVQVKVISFLQQWMRTYWGEDWDENDKLLEIVGQFCAKIENCYRNDPSVSEKQVQGGLKLVKMVHKTMDVQGRTFENNVRKHEAESATMSKFSKLTDMEPAVNKLRYGFVKVDNKRLAEQITLLDFKYFRAIKKRECLGQAWKKVDKLQIAPNICALIDQFNKMSKWVQATILLAKNVKTRGRLIKKFIKISYELLTLRNFQSFCAFHLALSSAVIHKLTQAWTHVPAKHRVRFEEMRVIFNTANNMGYLRKLHREAHPPLVPYTGIFLADLVSIEEGNRKHKDDGSVNFAKLMRLSNAIDNILLYQRTQYELQQDIAVQSLLLQDFKINAKLDADYIYKFSADVARKDLPLKKKSMLSIFSSAGSTK